MRGHMRRAAQVSVSGAAWLGFALRRCSQRPGVSGALSPRSPWTGQLRSRTRSLPHRACPRPWRLGWTRWIQPGQHQRPEPHSGLCSRSSPTALRAPAPAPQATLLGPTAPLLPGEPAGAIQDFHPLLAPQPPHPSGGQRTSEARGKQQKRAPACSQGSLGPPRGAVTPRGRRHAFPPALGEKNSGKAGHGRCPEAGAPRGSWPDGRCEARGPTAARCICSAGRSCLGGPAVTHAPQTCGACARGHGAASRPVSWKPRGGALASRTGRPPLLLRPAARPVAAASSSPVRAGWPAQASAGWNTESGLPAAVGRLGWTGWTGRTGRTGLNRWLLMDANGFSPLQCLKPQTD